MSEIENLSKTNNQKMDDLEKIKMEKQENLDELTSSLEKLRERRKQLEYQLSIIRN